MSHRYYLNLLWPLTRDIVPVGNARVLSAIVYKGKIISIGMNSGKTHPLQKKYGKNSEAIHLHAEINTIIQARRELTLDELSKSVLYIIRRKNIENTDIQVPGLAKPCCGCMKAIRDFNIRQVVYTVDNIFPGTNIKYQGLILNEITRK